MNLAVGGRARPVVAKVRDFVSHAAVPLHQLYTRRPQTVAKAAVGLQKHVCSLLQTIRRSMQTFPADLLVPAQAVC